MNSTLGHLQARFRFSVLFLNKLANTQIKFRPPPRPKSFLFGCDSIKFEFRSPPSPISCLFFFVCCFIHFFESLNSNVCHLQARFRFLFLKFKFAFGSHPSPISLFFENLNSNFGSPPSPSSFFCFVYV